MAKSLLSSAEKTILNSAIYEELFASNVYKHIANQLQRLGYFGAQKFFLTESSHELEHYQKLVDYMDERGDVATVPAISAPSVKIKSLVDAVTAAYDIEAELGTKYEDWYKKSYNVTTQQFLLQYIEKQRVSVGEFGGLLARLELVKDDSAGILMIDAEMGKS